MVLGISTKGNPEQQEEMRLIMDNQHPYVVVTGDAGTGKNFIALATALELCLQKKYKKIYYARNPVQLGCGIGYLPGGEDEKLAGFMNPIYDTLSQLEEKGHVMKFHDMLKFIDIIPLYSLRGRTIPDNCILIVDECQNCDLTVLRTIMTRTSEYTKTILLGSSNQIDDRHQNKNFCDFDKMIQTLVYEEQIPEIAHIQLVKSMRAPWCVKIDKILTNLEKIYRN